MRALVDELDGGSNGSTDTGSGKVEDKIDTHKDQRSERSESTPPKTAEREDRDAIAPICFRNEEAAKRWFAAKEKLRKATARRTADEVDLTEEDYAPEEEDDEG
jgi:hypothetical protein